MSPVSPEPIPRAPQPALIVMTPLAKMPEKPRSVICIGSLLSDRGIDKRRMNRSASMNDFGWTRSVKKTELGGGSWMLPVDRAKVTDRAT
jgi:hypothetical protein